MKIKFAFYGRKEGAIGMTYFLPGTFVGEGRTQDDCLVDAINTAYMRKRGSNMATVPKVPAHQGIEYDEGIRNFRRIHLDRWWFEWLCIWEMIGSQFFWDNIQMLKAGAA